MTGWGINVGTLLALAFRIWISTQTAFVDQIDDGTACLLIQGQPTIDVPTTWLPTCAVEGSMVRLGVCLPTLDTVDPMGLVYGPAGDFAL